MCGIAGIFAFAQGAVPTGAADRMASTLRHRGPDEGGFHVSSRAVLAHRRLKIIDLSPVAAQPMTDEASRYHVMFNGEIYNFRELRAGLEPEYRFFSQSDTEVILRLFQKHREAAWPMLRGMFAAVVLDSREDEMFLARDHAGIKPLYYAISPDFFVFASELDGILASGLVQSEPDSEAIAGYLQLGYFRGRATPYRGIRKLLPGEYCRVTQRRVTFHRFWNVRDFLAPRELPHDLEGRLDELLRKSVAGHMISDVPLGAFLSGGVDSSLLVALMSSLSEAPVRTFTVGFPRMGYYDERPAAARIAQHFRTEHHEYSVDQGVADLVPELPSVFGEPFADSSAVPTLCLARLARQNVTVALSGTGGDEVFGGYRKYMAGYWMQWYASVPSALRSTIRKTVSMLPASRQSLWRERALLLQRFTTLDPKDRPEVQMNRVFTRAEMEQLLPGVKETALQFDTVTATAAENLMLFDFEVYLPDDLLVKEDRCTMRYGLESRVPYLDRDLIEFMASVPVKHKVTGTATKRLFKKVAARYLPEWVLKRPKHGFGSPVAEWLRSDLRDLATDVLLHPSTMAEVSVVRSKLEEHLQGKADHSRQLWTLLMLELWRTRTRN